MITEEILKFSNIRSKVIKSYWRFAYKLEEYKRNNNSSNLNEKYLQITTNDNKVYKFKSGFVKVNEIEIYLPDEKLDINYIDVKKIITVWK